MIPAHRSLVLPGIHAYADATSVAAGQEIAFHVSSSLAYRLSVYPAHRTEPASCIHHFANAPGLQQPISPGSYIHIGRGLDADVLLQGLTLECWLRPWNGESLQGVITQYDASDDAAAGFGLFIDGDATLAVYLGDGVAHRLSHRYVGPSLLRNRWQHVVATFDGRILSLWIDGLKVRTWSIAHAARAGVAPLRIGAFGRLAQADGFLDADIAMPVLYASALSPAAIAARFAERGARSARGDGIEGCWPLDEERGATIRDTSLRQRTGTLINHATWMIGGPAFDGQALSRHAPYDWEQDTGRGHGLRLASDDLYDCRWQATQRMVVPEHTRPGLYIARIETLGPGAHQRYDLTFVVRKSAWRAAAPLLVVCSTSSWRAYASTPFAHNQEPAPIWGSRGIENSDPQAPAFSCYRSHRAGQPSYYSGMRMPWPNAAPDVRYKDLGNDYGQWVKNELCLHQWLYEQGYEFDVVSDYDLHVNPECLKAYGALIINGHSEYWSLAAYEGLQRYLHEGGDAIVLSGNAIYWRTTFNGDGSVMECRKLGVGSGGQAGVNMGESYHSQDRGRGGLMRECGYPAWRLVGLETLGWAVSKATDFGVYETIVPGHFLFNTPEVANLAIGSRFGEFPGEPGRCAVGHEWDVRLATLARVTTVVPEGASLPAEAAGITTIALGTRAAPGSDDVYFDYFGRRIGWQGGLSAEMIYWERPDGGRVFHAGAIAFSWVLPVDPRLQILLRNVLYHFGIRQSRQLEHQRTAPLTTASE